MTTMLRGAGSAEELTWGSGASRASARDANNQTTPETKLNTSKSGAVTLKIVQAMATGAKITRTPSMILAAEITMIETVAMRAATKNINRPARAPVM